MRTVCAAPFRLPRNLRTCAPLEHFRAPYTQRPRATLNKIKRHGGGGMTNAGLQRGSEAEAVAWHCCTCRHLLLHRVRLFSLLASSLRPPPRRRAVQTAQGALEVIHACSLSLRTTRRHAGARLCAGPAFGAKPRVRTLDHGVWGSVRRPRLCSRRWGAGRGLVGKIPPGGGWWAGGWGQSWVGGWIWAQMLLPSAVHLEERLTVNQSLRQASSQSDRSTQFGFFFSGKRGPKQWGGEVLQVKPWPNGNAAD